MRSSSTVPGMSRVARSVLIFLISSLTPAAIAQDCAWLTGTGTPGVSGTVIVTDTWDPDGPGPTQPLTIIGGDFFVPVSLSTIGGSLNTSNLVAWSGDRFVPLVPAALPPGSGWAGTVRALAAIPGGDLIVAGQASTVGGVAIANIARWDGAAWHTLGQGLNGPVFALAVLNSGDIVAAGGFTQSGATVVGPVARWNGSAWSAFAPGSPTNVATMLTLPSGDLVIGGQFTMPGVTGLARWNGAAWVGYPAGVSAVNHLLLVPGTTDQFFAAGSYNASVGGSLNLIARWTGSAWAPLGNGLGQAFGSEAAGAIAVRPNGDVLVGGEFSNTRAFGAEPVVTLTNLARWDGTRWSDPSGAAVNGQVYSLTTLPNGHVVIGGNFLFVGGVIVNAVAQWDGSRWNELGQGFSGMYSMVEAPNGDVLAAGAATLAGGVAVNRVARWDGSHWNAIGAGLNNLVNTIARLPNGDIVVGGTFTQIATVPTQTPAGRIARWNGAAWDNMGGGSLTGGSMVNALAVRTNGELVAGGAFTAISGVSAAGVARWTQATGWTSMATSSGSINCLLALPNGDILAGGGFSGMNGVLAPKVARWSEIAGWTALGGGPPGTVYGLARAANGDILAAGDFTQLSPTTIRSRISRWNGSTWTPVGNDAIGGVALAYAVCERPDGTIVAGGNFPTMSGVSAPNIALWNGSAWSPMQEGINSHVRVLLNHSSGELWAGGLFNFANRLPAVGWARWGCEVTCHADVDDGTFSGTPDGAVTIDDLLYDLAAFENGSADADLDNGSGTGIPDGAVTIDDLIYFLVRYEAGC